MISATAGVMT